MSNYDGKFTSLLKLIQVLFQECDLIVWIAFYRWNEQVFVVTALCVKGDYADVESIDILSVVVVLGKDGLLILWDPVVQKLDDTWCWLHVSEVLLAVREIVMVAKGEE